MKKCTVEVAKINIGIVLPDNNKGGAYCPDSELLTNKLFQIKGVTGVDGPFVNGCILIETEATTIKTVRPIMRKCKKTIDVLLRKEQS